MDCEYEQFIDLLSNAESDFSFLLRRMMGGFGGWILRVRFLGNHRYDGRKTNWNKLVPPRISAFYWVARHQKILTMDTLRKGVIFW